MGRPCRCCEDPVISSSSSSSSSASASSVSSTSTSPDVDCVCSERCSWQYVDDAWRQLTNECIDTPDGCDPTCGCFSPEGAGTEGETYYTNCYTNQTDCCPTNACTWMWTDMYSETMQYEWFLDDDTCSGNECGGSECECLSPTEDGTQQDQMLVTDCRYTACGTCSYQSVYDLADDVWSWQNISNNCSMGCGCGGNWMGPLGDASATSNQGTTKEAPCLRPS